MTLAGRHKIHTTCAWCVHVDYLLRSCHSGLLATACGDDTIRIFKEVCRMRG